MKTKWINILLLAAVVVLAAVPLLTISSKNGEEIFQGADDRGQQMIMQIQPDYKPWFSGIWTPPSGEISNLFFALQGAIGGGVLCYYLGLKRGQARKAEQAEPHASN